MQAKKDFFFPQASPYRFQDHLEPGLYFGPIALALNFSAGARFHKCVIKHIYGTVVGMSTEGAPSYHS